MLESKQLFLGLAVSSVFMLSVHAEDTKWQSYRNERFGSTIKFPSAIFTADPPPENGDGLHFTAGDGGEFTISGQYNVTPDTVQTLESFLRHPEPDSTDKYADATYRLQKEHLLVLSVTRQDRIYYEKFLFSKDNGIIHHFSISYPSEFQKSYGPIVERMSKSLGYTEERWKGD